MIRRIASLLSAGAVVLACASAAAETVVTPPEAREGKVIAREIDAGVTEISRALRSARQARDVKREVAESDRLSQAHSASKRAHEVAAALEQATEPTTRGVRLTELRTLRARVRRLSQESSATPIGRTDGDTRVTWSIDPQIPEAP
jgi:phage protein D